MNRYYNFKGMVWLFCAMTLFPCCSYSQAQEPACILGEPLIHIDFGSNSSKIFNPTSLKNYQQVNHNCPDDGEFSISARTGNCFGGNWHSLNGDHTPGDSEGRMLIVNASLTPGAFFMVNIEGLKPGASYELGAWLVNICLSASGCTPTPPTLSFDVRSNGTLVKKFVTGLLLPTLQPQWKQYNGIFKLPANSTSINLQIEDLTEGGCGNDFAIDDITIRECKHPAPPVQKTEVVKIADKPILKNLSPVKSTPASTRVPIPQKKQEQVEVPGNSPGKPGKIITATNREPNKEIALPPVLATRSNPVVRTIETGPGELLVELYDNGQVDGDTVSIYHNNKLLLSGAGLSEKPLKFKILVDAANPHHELIMVAENLGSIPPNTSLMLVTSASNRYEVFISSSQTKNAKIVIDLKKAF